MKIEKYVPTLHKSPKVQLKKIDAWKSTFLARKLFGSFEKYTQACYVRSRIKQSSKLFSGCTKY